MIFKHLLLLAACLAVVRAQDGLIETLAIIPDLSELVAFLQMYPDLTSWLEGLTDITFLAPNNDAFGAVGSKGRVPVLPTDLTAVEQLMAYHVLEGSFYDFNAYDYISVSLGPSVPQRPWPCCFLAAVASFPKS
jgi:uncharacterized surface protein with fasciclin (FAS1) repeats